MLVIGLVQLHHKHTSSMVKQTVNTLDHWLLGQVQIHQRQPASLLNHSQQCLIMPYKISALWAELSEEISEFSVGGEKYSLVGVNSKHLKREVSFDQEWKIKLFDQGYHPQLIFIFLLQ